MVVLERDSCQWNLWDETWLHGGALENDRHAFCVCSLRFGGLAYVKTYVSFFFCGFDYEGTFGMKSYMQSVLYPIFKFLLFVAFYT